MGGASGGELAAQLVIDAMRRELEGAPQRPAAEALRSALVESNRIIVLRRQNPAFSSMGTTIVSAFFSGAEVVIGSAGDSRAYLVRNGVIQQLTIDHTYVQDLVNKGQLKADEALTHPQAHVLTKAIGSEPSLEFDVKSFWVWQVAEDEPKDFLVLATDGLYSLVTEGEITDIVSKSSPQQACSDLVERAKSRGGFDNITIAVIPLTGQLKSEPPIGYQRPARRQASADSSQDEGPVISVPVVLLGFVCMCLAVLFTIVLFGFYLAK
jgi:protein phosphatase